MRPSSPGGASPPGGGPADPVLPVGATREGGIPSVFRPKRNRERRKAPVLPVGGRFRRDGSPLEPGGDAGEEKFPIRLRSAPSLTSPVKPVSECRSLMRWSPTSSSVSCVSPANGPKSSMPSCRSDRRLQVHHRVEAKAEILQVDRILQTLRILDRAVAHVQFFQLRRAHRLTRVPESQPRIDRTTAFRSPCIPRQPPRSRWSAAGPATRPHQTRAAP